MLKILRTGWLSFLFWRGGVSTPLPMTVLKFLYFKNAAKSKIQKVPMSKLSPCGENFTKI